jgi:thioredoxin 1
MGSTVTLTPANFKQVVEGSRIPVLVDFWAERCPPCRKVAPILDELAREYAGKASFAMVNVDQNSSLATQYGVMSLPTLILFKNGKPLQQVVGLRPKEELCSLLDDYAGK